MPDTRTLRQKLEAMANQTRSPKEAAIAREKLAMLDAAIKHYPPGSRYQPDLEAVMAQIWREIEEAGPCPGCGHMADKHAGGMCYGQTSFCDCNWSVLGEGNRWRLPKGWHSLSDMIGRAV